MTDTIAIDLNAFAREGAVHCPAVLSRAQATALAERLAHRLSDPSGKPAPGKRLLTADWGDLLASTGAMGRIAAQLIGSHARPARAVLFDKTPAANWSVAWHQDRTIAVRERIETEGYGPWSTKDGICHVAPPVSLLAGMVTLRLHLDDCPADNAPLKVALGTHRLGFVAADQAARVAEAHAILSCLAETGDVWAYSTLILHASERSQGAGRRRVLQVDYAADDLPNGLDWRGVS